MSKINIGRLEDYPEWRDANQKLTKLQEKLSETEHHIATLQGELNVVAEGTREGEVERKAAALLTGNLDAAITHNRGMLTVSEDLGRAREERGTYVRAIEMLNKEINQLRGRLSSRICEALGPEYRRLVQKQERQVREVARTNDEIREFLKAIEGQGVSVSNLRNMVFAGVGLLSEDYSKANYYLRECREFGFV